MSYIDFSFSLIPYWSNNLSDVSGNGIELVFSPTKDTDDFDYDTDWVINSYKPSIGYCTITNYSGSSDYIRKKTLDGNENATNDRYFNLIINPGVDSSDNFYLSYYNTNLEAQFETLELVDLSNGTYGTNYRINLLTKDMSVGNYNVNIISDDNINKIYVQNDSNSYDYTNTEILWKDSNITWVLHCKPKLPIIQCLEQTPQLNSVQMINPYTFNNVSYNNNGFIGVYNGNYELTGVTDSHPIGFVINDTEKFEVIQGTIYGTKEKDGIPITYYTCSTNNIIFNVKGDFGTISYDCFHHGYMGGKLRLRYTDICPIILEPPGPAPYTFPTTGLTSTTSTATLICTIEGKEYGRVAAFFDDDDLRTPSGGNSISLIPVNGKYVASVNIGFLDSESGELNFKIKYMDIITGYIYVCTPTYNITAGDIDGSIDNPISFTLDNTMTQTITTSPGWKWISFCVDLSNKILNNTIVNNVTSEAILIKAKEGAVSSATYYDIGGYTGWNPTYLDATVWKNGISYQLYNKTNDTSTLSLTNTIISSINISISPGWNWIGFINTTEKTINNVIPNGKPGYFIKAKEGAVSSATWYDVDGYTGWSAPNFKIIPGEGYQFFLDETIFNSNEIINITN